MSGQVKVGDPATPWHGGPDCAEMGSGAGYECTEPRGHAGDHVACGLTQVCAVWPNETESTS